MGASLLGREIMLSRALTRREFVSTLVFVQLLIFAGVSLVDMEVRALSPPSSLERVADTCPVVGHADHILEWFDRSDVCPVADCDCRFTRALFKVFVAHRFLFAGRCRT